MSVLSAKGATSLEAWGIVPGLLAVSLTSAEGAIQGSGVNRAYSAAVGIALIHGALPQAKMNSAPLALGGY